MNQTSPRKEKRIGLKIISVVLAVLLWFYVINKAPATGQSNSVQVELKQIHLAEGLSYNGPTKVSVRVWGASPDKESIVAYVDLANLGPGTSEVPVSVEPIKGALLTMVEPKQVKVELYQVNQHVFGINSEVSKNPPTGYQLMNLAIIPEKCVIKGQESDVGRVSRVVCSVDLSSVKETGSLKGILVARDSKGNQVQGITIVPETVSVYAIVAQKEASKKVPVKVTIGTAPASPFLAGKILAVPETVTVYGPEAALTDLKEIAVKPLDLTGKNASFTQEVELTAPQGIKVYPAKVMLNIEITKTSGKEGV
ncbi:MAG: CdaR family protein [Syntrophomonadaceae bacterium]